MSLIPEHLYQQMSEDERERVKAFIRGAKSSCGTFPCPHCGGTVQISVRTEIDRIEAPDAPKVKLPPLAANRLPAQYQALVDAAKANGLLEHFKQAMLIQNPQCEKSDFEVMFCRFWPKLEPVHLTARQNLTIFEHYGNGAEVWGHGGVYVIVMDGLVHAFMPQKLLKTSVSAARFQLDVKPQLDLWVKGPYGYVPMEARGFASELRRQNVGKFGALVQ